MSETAIAGATPSLRAKATTSHKWVRRGRRLAIGAGYAAILLIYAPILWLAIMSVSKRPLTGIPWPLSGEWYAGLFGGDMQWLEPLRLSLFIAVIVSVSCMVAATIIGRALPLLRSRGRVLLVFLIPLFVPGIVAGAGMFIYYRVFLGLKMGVWSLAVGHFLWAFPFALLAMLVVTSRFDHRLLEAAADLGASRWQRFWHIEFPLVKPGIVACGFFGFLLSFNELPRSIFMRSGEVTLPLHLWASSSSHLSSVPLIYGLSTIITLASVLLVVGVLWLLFFRGENTL